MDDLRTEWRLLIGPQAGSIVVRVEGEVDIATAPELCHALRHLVETGERHVTVDLGGCSFIDNAGIRVLDEIGDLLRAHQGSLHVVHPSRPAARLLRLRTRLFGAPPWQVDGTV